MILQVPDKSTASIRWLASPTSWTWLEQANARPMEVLIDHAHCERKAAGFATQLMFRYLCEPGLGEVLSPLAREELEHFGHDGGNNHGPGLMFVSIRIRKL